MDLELVKSNLENKLNSIGYDLASFKYQRNGKDNVLNIVVDRVAPIDMNDIVEVSNILSSYLDEIDAIEDAYTLDVSSLGAEKPLKVETLSNYVNSYVNVHLINPIDGENIYEGTIVEVKDDKFVLAVRVKTRVKNLVILFNNIYKIRLAIKF